MVNAVLRPRAIKTPPGKSYIASFFGRMQGQLELLHLFFCSSYAACAPAQRQNHIETFGCEVLLIRCRLSGDFLYIGAEPGGASQTLGELHSAPVIAHNMAARVHEDI
jgi:hypothetical protein